MEQRSVNIIARPGRSQGGSWGAREPPPPLLQAFFKANNLHYSGDNLLSTLCSTQCDPPPLKNTGYAHACNNIVAVC